MASPKWFKQAEVLGPGLGCDVASFDTECDRASVCDALHIPQHETRLQERSVKQTVRHAAAYRKQHTAHWFLSELSIFGQVVVKHLIARVLRPIRGRKTIPRWRLHPHPL